MITDGSLKTNAGFARNPEVRDQRSEVGNRCASFLCDGQSAEQGAGCGVVFAGGGRYAAGMKVVGTPERFMVDHMLVKLGKYLRVLGYDATWDPRLRTHELILRANREARVFVTRNTRLPDQYPPVDRLVTVRATDPVEQLREVSAELGCAFQPQLFSACIRCNVPLVPVPDKSAICDRVHPNVYARYEHFFRCPSCGTVFWKGSHVRNTCRKLGVEDASEGDVDRRAPPQDGQDGR